MNRCPITYKPCGDNRYSEEGLKKLAPNLKDLAELPLTKEEQVREAAERADKMSIQGVQPKLSARLIAARGKFEIVNIHGTFILKPQNVIYPELPENESLSMKLAEAAGIETPLNGLVYSKDGSRTYFVKRFDRYGRNKKLALEDFAQLAGKNRDTKYDSSLEKIVEIVDEYCTFPILEKIELFKRVLFNYIIGNEDMHLKNYSLITIDGTVKLAPAYDFVNTTVALKNPREESALPLRGRKSRINRSDLLDYLAGEKMGLNEKQINSVNTSLVNSISKWKKLISVSFLSAEMKLKYENLLNNRKEKLNF